MQYAFIKSKDINPSSFRAEAYVVTELTLSGGGAPASPTATESSGASASAESGGGDIPSDAPAPKSILADPVRLERVFRALSLLSHRPRLERAARVARVAPRMIKAAEAKSRNKH